MRYPIWTMIGVLLLSPAAAQAQYSRYYPGYDYYGYGNRASTVEEGIGRSVADVIRSQGLYNQLSADAAVRVEEARRQYIENYKKAAETYIYVRDRNKARRAAEFAERNYKSLRWLQQRRPRLARLSDTQLVRPTGIIKWPNVLMDHSFSAQRSVLDQLFAKRAREGGLHSIADRQAVRNAQVQLMKQLRKRIKEMHPQNFVLGRRFIEAVGNEVFYPTS